MNAKDLYQKLDGDFITENMSDEWSAYMGSIEDFLCDNFKQYNMGLVCDFAEKITRVYTAVFPSREVMQKILDDGVEDAMLFMHHPSVWDIRRPEIFYQMDPSLLEQFRQRHISIYILHVPLDAYGEYSTSVTLARALGLEIEKPFHLYHGIYAGVIGKTHVKTVQELQEIYVHAVGHDVKLYRYGDAEIRGRLVAVVAGGGNDMDVVRDVLEEDVNTIVTGVTAKNEFTKEIHDIEEKEKINLFGGTHYSTEKFACIEMCDYFKDLGFEAEFIPDQPIMEDL